MKRHWFLFPCLLLGGIQANASEPPDWLASAARVATPALAQTAPAVVLLDEIRYEVDATGNLLTRKRLALRIIHEAGRRFADNMVYYDSATDKVQSLDSWVIRNGKAVENCHSHRRLAGQTQADDLID